MCGGEVGWLVGLIGSIDGLVYGGEVGWGGGVDWGDLVSGGVGCVAVRLVGLIGAIWSVLGLVVWR